MDIRNCFINRPRKVYRGRSRISHFARNNIKRLCEIIFINHHGIVFKPKRHCGGSGDTDSGSTAHGKRLDGINDFAPLRCLGNFQLTRQKTLVNETQRGFVIAIHKLQCARKVLHMQLACHSLVLSRGISFLQVYSFLRNLTPTTYQTQRKCA